MAKSEIIFNMWDRFLTAGYSRTADRILNVFFKTFDSEYEVGWSQEG